MARPPQRKRLPFRKTNHSNPERYRAWQRCVSGYVALIAPGQVQHYGHVRPRRRFLSTRWLILSCETATTGAGLDARSSMFKQKSRPESLLLRGDDLDAAKEWMAQRSEDAPAITEAQRTFIAASEQAESVRLGREHAQPRRAALCICLT